MSSIPEEIERIGKQLVACVDCCLGICQKQAEGILPRGLFLERPNSPGRGCVAVGLNPGISSIEERDYFRKNGTSYDMVKAHRESINGIPYFKRTRRVIDQLGLSGPILWSNLAKCENLKERKRFTPPLQTLRHCANKFLLRELKIVPRDWAILGLGREAFRTLAYMLPDHAVLGIPHPTGANPEYSKMFENDALRSDLRKRAEKAWDKSEVAWLGTAGNG